MKIDFLIATMNRVDFDFLNIMFQYNDINVISGVVVNQCTKIPVDGIIKTYKGFKIISVSETGLSNSRNLALENSDADICVVVDDDVIYKADVVRCIKSMYKNKNVDVAKFQIETPEGEKYKNYKNHTFKNNIRNGLSTSSIEVSFKRKAIIKHNISFDTYFGLGAIFKGSEDIIFVTDCIKKGLGVFYFPVPIVMHPLESSGTDYRPENEDLIVNVGAALTRIFGSFNSFLMLLVFTFKRYKYYKGAYSIKGCLSLLLKGRRMYLNKKLIKQ